MTELRVKGVESMARIAWGRSAEICISRRALRFELSSPCRCDEVQPQGEDDSTRTLCRF